MSREYRCTTNGCGFYLRADSEDEVIEHVRLHADEVHGQWLRPYEARAAVRSSASNAGAADVRALAPRGAGADDPQGR